ncbi:SERTA domain-containing protein 3 [Amia ocellicauda]|uniref:SERTA domain-containing protein 3 n=1 Tax=Amia ocellicauda TaxID=2972642 RepID=UPI003464BF27
MTGKGLKRKLLEDGDQPEGAGVQKGSSLYAAQRQSVLNISLDKFHRGQMLVEPSLRRSVLIANTLRQIQEEIRHESGAGLPPLTETSSTLSLPPLQILTPVVSEPTFHRDAPPPRMSLENHPMGFGDSDDWMLLSNEEDFSLSSAISSILKDLDIVLDGSSQPASQQRPPLASIENMQGDTTSKVEGLLPRTDRNTGCPEGCKPSESVFGSFEIMRSSYLTDVALDDLFLDIDTSVYEREGGSLGARSLTAAAGDELLKYLPSCASPSPFSVNQSVRDLNELEHIMEILVGS